MTTSETGAHLIDGEWVTSSATGISMNPARPDEPVGEYPLGDGSTVADAVGAATAALRAGPEALHLVENTEAPLTKA